MRVSDHLIWRTNYYFLCHCKNRKTFHRTLQELGVTGKQWKKYIQTGRLKVRPRVAAKMELISTTIGDNGFIIKDTSNLPTLLKMIDARYKGSEP